MSKPPTKTTTYRDRVLSINTIAPPHRMVRITASLDESANQWFYDVRPILAIQTVVLDRYAKDSDRSESLPFTHQECIDDGWLEDEQYVEQHYVFVDDDFGLISTHEGITDFWEGEKSCIVVLPWADPAKDSAEIERHWAGLREDVLHRLEWRKQKAKKDTV